MEKTTDTGLQRTQNFPRLCSTDAPIVRARPRLTATPAQLDEIARHREHLIAAEKKRLGATRLLDSDYDNIASYMAAWKQRRYGVQG